jgi:hypothetical protein
MQNNNENYYEAFEELNYSGQTLVDGFSVNELKKDLENLYCDLSIENQSYGYGEKEIYVFCNGNYVETLLISWDAEEPEDMIKEHGTWSV